MAAFDLTSSDVMTVLNSNNYQSATGQATGYFTLFNGNAETQVGNIEELKRLVVATRDSKVIRLSDIAKVSLEKSHDTYRASANGREAVVLAINAAPTANPINIAHDVLEMLPSLKSNMPSTMEVTSSMTRPLPSTNRSSEVIKTIAEAAAIVLVVITLFLGSFRAVIIPIITIPSA
jgi:multidrug efflux pump